MQLIHDIHFPLAASFSFSLA